MRVVAIGAHPDDVEIGVGGTVHRHVALGHPVTYLIATDGTAGCERDDAARRDEAQTAASVLGVDDVRFLDFEDTDLGDGGAVVSAIESHVTDCDPDRVYVHAAADTHQDHRNCARAAVSATRRDGDVFAYETYSTRPTFSPNHYVSLSAADVEAKLEAIRIHESQTGKTYMDEETIRGLARFRGNRVEATFAEAFEVVRSIDRFDGRG
ncbi:PIG-L deacetylase family protein [Halovivax gelatinilyticus]|uniref:PIG-L deacetylase family protein n=1 Tax=Halovivax gelatinilyticus TaxID=2961597 RepID=UPI0020CA7CA1|nr:PIG-L deacetylase family protein [Halovivax gelatinilyticus]